MQTVGAQWLLIDESPLLVSLVQTASSLPIVLLALPAGAWADLIDRKRLLLGAQLAMFLAAAALAGTAFLGVDEPVADPAAHLRAGLRERGGRPGLAGDPAGPGRTGGAAAGGGAERVEHERRPGGGPGHRRPGGGGGRRRLGVRAQRRVVRRHRRRGGPLAGAGAARHRAAGAAGRGAAVGRTVRAQRVDRAPVAVPGGAVHPGGQRGVGAAAGGRGHQPRARLGGLRGAAGHGRDRRGGRRGRHPAGPGADRLGPAGHRGDGGQRAGVGGRRPRCATRGWSASPCCRSARPGSR